MIKTDISISRCFNHPSREAVARCVECGRFFCRECIIEHNEKFICAACLKNKSIEKKHRKLYFSPVIKAIQVLIGILILLVFFYGTGKILVSVPAAFHEKTLWYKALGAGHSPDTNDNK